jgi:hypothetical protein
MKMIKTTKIFSMSAADLMTVCVTIVRLERELTDLRLRNALTTLTIIRALLALPPNGNIAVKTTTMTITKSKIFHHTLKNKTIIMSSNASSFEQLNNLLSRKDENHTSTLQQFQI